MIRYLSTGSSVIAALMSVDPHEPPIPPVRPDLLEFLLVRTLGNSIPHAGAQPRGEGYPTSPDRSSR